MKILKKVAAISLVTMCFCMPKVFAETNEINTATRVRKEASTEASIVTVLYPGNDVEVLEVSGEWSKIQRGEFIGYVKTEFLKKLEDKDEDIIVKNEVVNKIENKIEIKLENTIMENEVQTPITVTQNLPENKIAILIKTELNLLPNFFSKNLTNLDAGIVLEIIDEVNNWYKVRLDDGKEGWILKSKTTNKVLNVESKPEEASKKEEQPKNVETISKKGTINVDTANVREKASTSSKRVAFLDKGDNITIISEENGFYKITSEEIQGFVSKDLINISDDKVSSRGSAEERKEEIFEEVTKEPVLNEVSVNGEAVAVYAKQFLGVKYVLGGKTPDSGFDCAGFTKYVYKNFGINLGSIASAQNSIGEDVKREDLKIGDLILFQNEGKTSIGHTGVYLGNGDFIHAANPERGVVIDNINNVSYYDTRFVNAKRLVN